MIPTAQRSEAKEAPVKENNCIFKKVRQTAASNVNFKYAIVTPFMKKLVKWRDREKQKKTNLDFATLLTPIPDSNRVHVQDEICA